jgi:hypothetical protein
MLLVSIDTWVRRSSERSNDGARDNRGRRYREMVGEFDFDQMLRNDDSVTIAWPEDDDGLRIFDVAEVIHVAVGAPSDWSPCIGIPLTAKLSFLSISPSRFDRAREWSWFRG